MKIWHISDTHGYHKGLNIPSGIDLVIHSGDATNYRDNLRNHPEMVDFVDWFSKLPIKHKVFVGGNHDTSLEAKPRIWTKDAFAAQGIIYLENSDVTIEGIKIWGSPCTPTFGQGWAFNVRRDALYDLWKTIPTDTDIIVTHGPPKGVLDLATKYYGKAEEGRYYGEIMEFCGCKALRDICVDIKPKIVMFGHIHNNNGITNAGYRTLGVDSTIYSNGSVMTDGKFDLGPSSNGNIFNL